MEAIQLRIKKFYTSVCKRAQNVIKHLQKVQIKSEFSHDAISKDGTTRGVRWERL